MEGEPRTADATRADRIREILEDLIRQRQSLRVHDAGGEQSLLEANRRSIVYWQAELARALVEQHGRREAVA